jgi:hypothetical protein
MYGFSFDEILGKYEAGELSWADVPYPLRPVIENSISTKSTVSSVLE